VLSAKSHIDNEYMLLNSLVLYTLGYCKYNEGVVYSTKLQEGKIVWKYLFIQLF